MARGELRLRRRLDLRMFDTTGRRGAVSRASDRIGYVLVQKLRGLMVKERHTGKIYKVYVGGRARLHQASAVGQRPAMLTHTLLSAIKSKSTKARTITVYVDLQEAPYAKYLQSPRMQRKIITVDDIEDFNKVELPKIMEELHKELWKK